MKKPVIIRAVPSEQGFQTMTEFMVQALELVETVTQPTDGVLPNEPARALEVIRTLEYCLNRIIPMIGITDPIGDCVNERPI